MPKIKKQCFRIIFVPLWNFKSGQMIKAILLTLRTWWMQLVGVLLFLHFSSRLRCTFKKKYFLCNHHCSFYCGITKWDLHNYLQSTHFRNMVRGMMGRQKGLLWVDFFFPFIRQTTYVHTLPPSSELRYLILLLRSLLNTFSGSLQCINTNWPHYQQVCISSHFPDSHSLHEATDPHHLKFKGLEH